MLTLEQVMIMFGQAAKHHLNTLRLRQNGHHFPDNIFKCIFLNENVWISIKISLKFVPKVPINNSPSLVQIMAWRRPGNKPLSKPMMGSLLTHICITRPQWVNRHWLRSKVDSEWKRHILIDPCQEKLRILDINVMLGKSGGLMKNQHGFVLWSWHSQWGHTYWTIWKWSNVI